MSVPLPSEAAQEPRFGARAGADSAPCFCFCLVSPSASLSYPTLWPLCSRKTKSFLDDFRASAGMADQSSHKIAFGEMVGNEAEASSPQMFQL